MIAYYHHGQNYIVSDIINIANENQLKLADIYSELHTLNKTAKELSEKSNRSGDSDRGDRDNNRNNDENTSLLRRILNSLTGNRKSQDSSSGVLHGNKSIIPSMGTNGKELASLGLMYTMFSLIDSKEFSTMLGNIVEVIGKAKPSLNVLYESIRHLVDLTHINTGLDKINANNIKGRDF